MVCVKVSGTLRMLVECPTVMALGNGELLQANLTCLFALVK